MSILHCCLVIVLMPLIGSVISGLFRKQIGHIGSHATTILGLAISLGFSVYVAVSIWGDPSLAINTNLYTWASGERFFAFDFHVGFLIDALTAVMLIVVTFVSLLVHIYSIGYMAEDDGYGRFFSYISLFTFMMLMLVTANNFLQLFFGWEGVGLVSYLLIGFWYQKESAIEGNLKAFLVNRVGDFGFVLGIAMLLNYTGSLDYSVIFGQAQSLSQQSISLFSGHTWSVLTLTCILLFIGAMAKSAQVPLHVWLPESMEGPTPISALIHAATMVTAGVFMLARISPLLELSTTALSVIIIIGATGALFTGLIGIVVNDIKRVVAYSTLSQLGYMMVAMGASAFSAGIFHLVTHACFKALLFLGAGSVIMAMHHEQDMRKMGGLWKKLPITYVTFIIGSLALCAVPPFAGFYSKDTIIEATKLSTIPGSTYAYVCVVLGAIVTAIYTFRAVMLTFHGKTRAEKEVFSHAKESPWVVWLPLILLAIPSVVLGYFLYMPILFDKPSLLGDTIVVLPSHDVLSLLAKEVVSPLHTWLEAPSTLVFWLTIAAIVVTCLAYSIFPAIPTLLTRFLSWPYSVLVEKYGFDAFNDRVFVGGSKALGRVFYRFGDQALIDGFFVNGTARAVRWMAERFRTIQDGYVYHYIALMILGLFAFIVWLTQWHVIS